MHRHLITALILMAALGAYALGMGRGAIAFLVLGGALELWFWIRALGGQRQRKSSAT